MKNREGQGGGRAREGTEGKLTEGRVRTHLYGMACENKLIRNGVWEQTCKSMARALQEHGKSMAIAWQPHGKTM
eukprot:16428773-Heterocapsa_arctica.AAC.1